MLPLVRKVKRVWDETFQYLIVQPFFTEIYVCQMLSDKPRVLTGTLAPFLSSSLVADMESMCCPSFYLENSEQNAYPHILQPDQPIGVSSQISISLLGIEYFFYLGDDDTTSDGGGIR